jgi:allophanate hydrolase subunit 2
MVAGAIEVPPSGAPIVLGPDHPTTGGYPVLAVILRADLGRFHAVPLGAPVRFRLADSQIAQPRSRD